jgi:hypothetical protein
MYFDREWKSKPTSPGRGRCGWIGSVPLHYYALLGLLTIAVSVGAQTPTGAPSANAPAAPAANPAPTNAAAVPASPMDRPLQLVYVARQTYARVQNYTALMIKQERMSGQLQPDNVMEMTLLNKPFSVNLRWLAPRQFVGQEACYVAGRNNNMMRVHTNGIAGAFGFVSIAPNDPRVLKNSRHLITEAGIGNLIEQLLRSWEAEKRQNQTQVRIAEYEYNRRRCTRVEAIHPDRATCQCSSYRTVVYFDNEYHLPVRIEMYDWPHSGGSPTGDLVECYSYVNLRFNVLLNHEIFNK